MKSSVSRITIILMRLIIAACITVPAIAQSQVIEFHFTGNIVVADPIGGIVTNSGSPITAIEANLSYDTVNGIGSSGLSITMPNFMGTPATFHDISLAHDGGDTIRGTIFIDWSGNYNMPMHIEWDAIGLLNAIDIGLDVGDVISGSILTKAGTGQQIDVFSATPYSDVLLANNAYLVSEGPAPLAATDNSLGLGYDIDGNYLADLYPSLYPNGYVTPFDGIAGLTNIGSGNSLTVTAVSSVPLPATVWLFGSGLIGLIGISRRKQSA
jgi:hypothetical protein